MWIVLWVPFSIFFNLWTMLNRVWTVLFSPKAETRAGKKKRVKRKRGFHLDPNTHFICFSTLRQTVALPFFYTSGISSSWFRSSACSILDLVRLWHMSKNGHMSSTQQVQFYWTLDLSLTLKAGLLDFCEIGF